MANFWDSDPVAAPPASGPAPSGADFWSQDAVVQPSGAQHSAQVEQQYASQPWYDKAAQAADDTMRLLANGMTFGYADKIAGALNGTGTAAERQKSADAATRAGSAATPTELLGSVMTPMGAAENGLSLAGRFGADALTGLKGLAARSGLMGAEGAGYGVVNAAGHDQNIGEGALTGAIGGAAMTPLVEGASAIASPLIKSAEGMLGVNNAGRARDAVLTALQRSGKTPQQVVAEMSQAASEGQPNYALADALGNSGQRMLAGVAQSPGAARQNIADFLENRQAGQGRRIAGFLDDAFNTSGGTAAQTQALVKDVARTANQNPYAAAYEQGDKAIWSPELERLSASPSVQNAMHGAVRTWPDNAIADGYGAMNPGAIVENGGQLSFLHGKVPAFPNLQFWDYTKRILDDDINTAVRAGQDSKVRTLTGLKNNLVKQLDQQAPAYANARATAKGFFGLQDAIEAGKQAAMRGRTEDTIGAFNQLSPEEQAAFRSGYVDPLIQQTQGAAVGVNKARPLINDATAAEFPAFAASGNAPQLQRQLGRENTMFATRNAALGNSRTAENMGDISDVNRIDPGLVSRLLRGDLVGAGMRGLSMAANAATGRNEGVRNMIADTLLKTGQSGGNGLLRSFTDAQTAQTLAQAKRQALARGLMGALIGSNVAP